MFIPKPLQDRWGRYQQVIDACFASANSRRANYSRLRAFYLYGTDDGDTQNTINKIYPHIDQILSFIYSNETTKFSTQIGASVDRMELKRVPPLNRALNDHWHASNGDIVFSNALEWAHVYGTEIFKQRWQDGQVEPNSVDPHDFGVLREDTAQISRQEAFAQIYWLSRGELETTLKAADHPRINEIMSNVVSSPKNDYGESNLVTNLIITSQLPASGSGLAQGAFANTLGTPSLYIPRVDEELVKMHELYIYDSALNDYRIITLASPYVVIFDRPIERVFVPEYLPFTQICPIPDKNYFWGRCEVERLIPLQKMRNERIAQIRRMLDKQASPPTSLAGFPGINDEMKLALDSPAGYIVNDNPTAKVERLAPQMPDDLFKEVAAIDAMFDEMSGLTNVTQGRGEAGVRSSGHASQLARLGSSRIKKRAMVVEDSLEMVATLYLKMMQRYDDKKEYKDKDGDLFAASQFTHDAIVKVDAHSNSPIFMEDLMEKAEMLMKVQAIKPERFIEMVGVPQEQVLVEELKTEIEPAKAKAKQEADILKLNEIRAKHAG